VLLKAHISNGIRIMLGEFRSNLKKSISVHLCDVGLFPGMYVKGLSERFP